MFYAQSTSTVISGRHTEVDQQADRDRDRETEAGRKRDRQTDRKIARETLGDRRTQTGRQTKTVRQRKRTIWDEADRETWSADRIAPYSQFQTLGHITTSSTVQWPSTADAETKVPFC